MATRLDRVTSTSARRAALRERREEDLRSPPRHAAGSPERLRELAGNEREIAPRALGGAMASWLALTFAICYVLIPSLRVLTGVGPNFLGGLLVDLSAFAMASFVAIVAVLAERPRIDLSPNARSPVLAAALGGFGVWALVHNVSPLLIPFSEMGALHLASLVGANIVEMLMLGAMFASFTKRTDVALALGGGFQLGLLGLVLTLLSLLV